MDLYNLRNNMRSRYFSMWEYLNNGFEIFKMFVKNHPLIVFLYFIFSTIMVLFITFPFTEQAIKMYEFTKKINNEKMQENINEYASLLSRLFSMLLLYALISLIIQFVAVIIRKKAGLEIEMEEEKREKMRKSNFKLGEIILKFVTMIAVYLIIGIVLMMFIVVLSLFLGSSSGLFIVSVIYLVLFLNILYLQQIYYLRDVNLVEAFRYNLYLSKGKRLRILLPIIMIALITFFINYALNYFTGITIGKLQNLQILGIVTSVTGGIVKTFSTLYTIIAENLVYFNVEYMDLKKLK